MSGGLDSSVTAALLHRAGLEVVGLSMQLFPKDPGRDSAGSCCTLDDFQDARRVAHQMGFPHFVMNFEEAFRSQVIEGFIQGYLDGDTPSPCIRCNQHLKFSKLLDRAEELGAGHVATGHYAEIAWDGHRWHLGKARDPQKDQSYFLFHHTQATLARTLFPLARFSKPEVRRMASDLGLHLADKAESQEICFVPGDDYQAFLAGQGRLPEDGSGDIRLLDGQVVGSHRGIWGYTVGQRRGLGVAWSEPLYVIRTDPRSRTVWVGTEADLYQLELTAQDLSWVEGAPTGPLACSARIRSRSPEAEALVIPLPDGRVKVAFAEPQRAIAPGQAVVFYRDGAVLGGGWICRPRV